jgi:hypothetical protein
VLDAYLILAVWEPMWEPNAKVSRDVPKALYEHESSSTNRRDSSRPFGSMTRFNLGAGGRGFESRHPDWSQTSSEFTIPQLPPKWEPIALPCSHH